ncbi:hypothetical protein DL98DRAFT_606118 [Cadophora sp. DSE1049]|nr:hypothetical protein DL98DRAFT_606118 [Cadophora sp. DSE1049]
MAFFRENFLQTGMRIYSSFQVTVEICRGKRIKYSCGCRELKDCSRPDCEKGTSSGIPRLVFRESKYGDCSYRDSVMASKNAPTNSMEEVHKSSWSWEPDESCRRKFQIGASCKVSLLHCEEKDVPDDGGEVDDDAVSLIYSVYSSPPQSDAGSHKVNSKESPSAPTNSIESRNQQPATPLLATATSSDVSEKKEAASRLLKSSIQHSLLKMQQPRNADLDSTRTGLQAQGDNAEDLKKIKDEILQAVDACFLLV